MSSPSDRNEHAAAALGNRTGRLDRKWTVIVDREADGTRLDRFLADKCGLGRRKVRRVIEAGLVSLDDAEATPGAKLKAGSRLRLAFDPDHLAELGPIPDPQVDLCVLQLTEDFLLLDKPPGIPSVALSPFERGSLANAVALAHPECVRASALAGAAPLESGLVHRLDMETSGLILAARTPEAYRNLRDLTRAGKLLKTYVALVQGRMEGSGQIDQAMVTERHKPRKMGPACASSQKALDAHSTYEVIESSDDMSLLQVTIARGRPHQVRFHLASIGHPILGDKTYGGPPAPDVLPPLALRCRALWTTDHRWNIDFEIPIPRAWLNMFA